MWNIPKLERAHKTASSAHRAAEQDALRVAGAQAEEHVRLRSTFHRRGANSLKDDTKSRVVRLRGKGVLKLSWSKKYAPFLEHGTGSYRTRGKYPIRPRRANALRFVVGGRVVFTKLVMHPGVKPYKFGWKATHAAYRVLEDRLRDGMARVSRRF